ncbi:MAG: hypothetical protein ACHQAV_06910 [Solirubrobacterales bacterium]
MHLRVQMGWAKKAASRHDAYLTTVNVECFSARRHSTGEQDVRLRYASTGTNP